MVFKRILKYTFAALMISIFLQSLAIIVIHYSDDMEKGNGTSKSFKNGSIIKYKTHKEVAGSPADFINSVQENSIYKIKKRRMVFSSRKKKVENIIDGTEAAITKKTRKLRIEEILAAARIAKKQKINNGKTIVKIDDLLKNRVGKKEVVKAENKVAMNIIASVAPLTFTNGAPKKIVKKEVAKKEFLYKVKRGDALVKIARKFKIKVSDLKKANDLKSSFIKIGQKLKIRINKKESISGSGQIRIASLNSFMRNPDKPSVRIKSSSKKKVKKKKKKKKAKKSLSAVIKKSKKSKRILKWPIRGRISSKFGMRIHPIRKVWNMHSGLDIAAKKGRIIRAAYSGKVIKSGWMGGYGRIIIIKHKNGVETRYAHCSKLLVKKGAYVKRGSRIAKIGSTGSSTGPHVHFEVRKNGKPVNPMKYLQ